MNRNHNVQGRRAFLKATGAAAASVPLSDALGVFHPGGRAVLKVGLIGCGGRGTGAAVQALRADPEVELVALADAFEDRLKGSLGRLQEQEDVGDRVKVAEDRRYVGFDAGARLIASDVDVVLLAEPPHFRAAHLEAAVAAGKHVFAEKPVAVDAAGARRVMEACREAERKRLSIVSGLCYRYDLAKRALYEKVAGGAIGDIVAMHTNYCTGGLWSKPRTDGMSDMEWQLRNWLYFTWLSGDHIAEQHIHSLDKCAWAMGDEPPVEAMSLGGRQVRTEEAYGHVYDHFATVFTYANGVKMFSYCRQQAGAAMDVNDYLIGTKGTASVQQHRIEGENPWRFRGRAPNMYQQEHDELFQAIRNDQPINNGLYMVRSTLMAIMGRVAGYTGQRVTWDELLKSDEQLGPKDYAWGDLGVDPVAQPGITRMG